MHEKGCRTSRRQCSDSATRSNLSQSTHSLSRGSMYYVSVLILDICLLRNRPGLDSSCDARDDAAFAQVRRGLALV